MKTKLQGLCPSIRQLPVLAASVYLLAAVLFVSCTSESDKTDRTSKDEADSTNRREVLISFKNKLTLKTTKTETKADVPIATEAENEIATLDVYVFGAKAEGDAYTFRERFAYRQDGSTLPAGAKELNLTPSADNAATTALLELQKGLFVRLYCIANQTELMNPAGNVVFEPLTYDMETDVLNDGTPSEADFCKFHTPLLTDASETLGMPLPMAGAQTTPIDLTDFSSSARVQAGFKLSRIMARFDISNKETESKFHLESISMGNGRIGTTFFPVKVYGAVPAADGELITYPACAFEGEKANEGLQASAFYSYPSPLEDKGYLILNGTYRVNKTEAKDVSYQIPFIRQTIDGGEVELNINANHRYTIGITKADEYHLDFTLEVIEWDEGGNLDEYNPNVDDAGEIAITIPETFKDDTYYDRNTRTVSMSLKENSRFDMDIESSATFTIQKTYVGGLSAQQYDWLEISGPEALLVSKAALTNYKYTFSIKEGYDKPRFPRAVVRITNVVDATEKVLFVEAVASPQVVEVKQDAGNRNTFDLDLQTASLYRVTGSKVKINISCPDGLTVTSLPEWLEAKVIENKVPVVTYELSLKEDSRDVEVDGDEGEVVFQNSKENTLTTAITVKLLDASIVPDFSALGGTGNTYDSPHDNVLGNINMPLSSGNNFTVSSTSLDGIKINIDFGSGPAWLIHNGTAATVSSKTGTMPNTVKFSLATDKAGDGKAEPATITLQNVSGGADHKFTVTPSYLVPQLTTSASATLNAAANYNIPSFTIAGNCPGGTTVEGPAWLTYSAKETTADNFSYTVKLDPSETDFPTSVPANQTIQLKNKADPDKSKSITVSFSEANAWLATDLSGYSEYTSSGYRVGTGGKTMTVSFYGMFAAPTVSASYDGTYCSSLNGGNTWLNNSQLLRTEIVNNRRKYIYNIDVAGSSGTDREYQLHKGAVSIRHNGTTLKSYTIWRGASYYSYPVSSGSGSGSPYYTAIRKGSRWWAPVNLGAIRVATKGHNGTNETGNYYQWGRRDATNPGCRTYNGYSSVITPDDNIFYTGEKARWLSTADVSLWQNGKNDPCPNGYRVPTGAEMKTWGSCTSESNGLYMVNADSGFPQLVFPRTGRKMYSNASMDGGYNTFFWSSTAVNGDYAKSYVYNGVSALKENDDYHSFGFVVRCIRK